MSDDRSEKVRKILHLERPRGRPAGAVQARVGPDCAGEAPRRAVRAARAVAQGLPHAGGGGQLRRARSGV